MFNVRNKYSIFKNDLYDPAYPGGKMEVKCHGLKIVSTHIKIS